MKGRRALDEGRTQGHSFPLQEDTFQEVPPCTYFCLTCLYVLFHLKVPTTHSETRMDRKKGRRRKRCTICQNNATMLQAAVWLNISVGREGKKYDRKESMEVKDDIFDFIKK